MARRNRIDEINTKYYATAYQNEYAPPGEFRRSATGSPAITTQMMHPAVISQNPRYLNPLVASPLGQRFEGYKNSRVQNITQGITRSRVVVTHNPAVAQTTISPARFYQIVQPIVEITPGKVTQTKVEQRISQSRPIEVSSKAQEEVELSVPPPPPPLGSKRMGQAEVSRRGCCERYCGINCGCCEGCRCCTWWCYLLLCLLLLPLIGFGIYACVNSRGLNWFGSADEVINQNYPPSADSITYDNFRGGPNINMDPINPNLNPNFNTNAGSQQNLPPGPTNPNLEPEFNQLLINRQNQNMNPALMSAPPATSSNPNFPAKQFTTVNSGTCRSGYFLYGKKCLSCPEPSIWNGTNCIKYIIVKSGQGTRAASQHSLSSSNGTLAASPLRVVEPKQHTVMSKHLKGSF